MENSLSDNAPETQFVAYSLGDGEYGLELSSIREIRRMPAVTPIPHTPRYIAGVVNLRGKIIPVVDVRRLLGLPAAERVSNRIIVTTLHGHPVGLLVDAVHQVLTARSNQLLEPPPMLGNAQSECVDRVARIDGRLILFLDIERLVSTMDTPESANAGAPPEPR